MAESSREEIAKLEALYASNPEGRVFTHLAEAYRKGGELDRARSILEEGLLKHPAYASAHVVLGRVLLDQQNPEEAAESFRRVLALDPHNHVALRSLGDIARKAGNNAEALQHFENLRTLDPNNDELSAIIDELSAAPAAVTPPPAAEPEPEAALEATPETVGEAPASPPAAPVSPATEFEEWLPEPSSEQLPGDLAGLAGFEASELPTFEGVDPLAELTSLNTSFDEGEGAVEGEEVMELDDLAPAELPTFEAEPPTFEAEPPTFEAELPSFEEEPPVFDAELPTFEYEPVGEVPPPVATPEPEPPTGEVVTETIAELYKSQGLYDRAADVYKALLAQRPGDAGLEQKLKEVQDLAAGPIAVPQPESGFPSEPWESPATWQPEPTFEAPAEPAATSASHTSEEAEAWLAGGEGAAESAPTPYAWAEQASAETDGGGPPISDYFQKLLSWKPSVPPVSAPAAAPAPAPEPEPKQAAPGMTDIEMEPDIMLLLDEAAETESVETAGFYDVSEPAPPAPVQDPWMAAEPPAIQEPWEAPIPAAQEAPAPVEPPAPTPEAAAPSTAATSEDAFDEWFGAPEPPAQAQAQAQPPAQSQSQTPAQTSEDSSPDDDDDLEMFRSWLQSLKK